MSALIRFFVYLVLVSIVLAGFAFSGYNSIEVPLWLGVELEPRRLGVWISMAFTAGGVLGLLLSLGLSRRLKARTKMNQLQTRLKKAEKKLSGVSQLPVKRS